MTPKPGDLKERMIPERPVDTPDGVGGVVRIWEPLAPVWAQVTPLAASASRSAERAGEVRRFDVIVRTSADLCRGMRLRWGDSVLDIIATRPLDASRRFLLLACEERP